jgi:hypothetical protein
MTINLEDIFKATPEEAETFSDILKSNSPRDLDEVKGFQTTAKFVVSEQGKLFVRHGTHEGHYVWHLGVTERPHLDKKKKPETWTAPIQRILYSVGQIIASNVPNYIIVDFYPPTMATVGENKIKLPEFTIIAREFVDHFSFQEKVGNVVANQMMAACQDFA